MTKLLLISLLPVLVLLYYIYKKDKEKEPVSLLLKIFFGGLAITVIAVILELALEIFFPNEEDMNPYVLFIYILISIAFIEEIVKYFVVYKLAYNNKEFNHLYDGIVYATFSSLGFACLENLLYVLPSDFSTGVMRAIMSVPGHLCDAIIMGHFIGFAKINSVNGRKKEERKYLIYSVLFATLAHTIYDYLIYCTSLYNSLISFFLFIIYLISLYIICFRLVKRDCDIDNNFINNKEYCNNCGKIIDKDDIFCSNCGVKK